MVINQLNAVVETAVVGARRSSVTSQRWAEHALLASTSSAATASIERGLRRHGVGFVADDPTADCRGYLPVVDLSVVEAAASVLEPAVIEPTTMSSRVLAAQGLHRELTGRPGTDPTKPGIRRVDTTRSQLVLTPSIHSAAEHLVPIG